MTNSIEDALEKAVKQVEVGEVTEGKGAEEPQEPQELSTRVKILLARKKNQRRRKRQHIPKALR